MQASMTVQVHQRLPCWVENKSTHKSQKMRGPGLPTVKRAKAEGARAAATSSGVAGVTIRCPCAVAITVKSSISAAQRAASKDARITGMLRDLAESVDGC